jgi:hypothetical protein
MPAASCRPACGLTVEGTKHRPTCVSPAPPSCKGNAGQGWSCHPAWDAASGPGRRALTECPEGASAHPGDDWYWPICRSPALPRWNGGTASLRQPESEGGPGPGLRLGLRLARRSGGVTSRPELDRLEPDLPVTSIVACTHAGGIYA